MWHVAFGIWHLALVIVGDGNEYERRGKRSERVSKTFGG
jgi:hypothetical protein